MKDLESTKNLIRQHVTLGNLLQRRGLIIGGMDEEQFSCVFHGADQKKSARYYGETDTAYCWVCKEKWDIFSFTAKLEGMTFSQVLRHYIKLYRIDISKLPESMEATIQKKIQARKVPTLDMRKKRIENLKSALTISKDKIEDSTYDKLVYSYMMLKFAVPEDQFEQSYADLKNAMLRVFSRIKAEGKVE